MVRESVREKSCSKCDGGSRERRGSGEVEGAFSQPVYVGENRGKQVRSSRFAHS